jgi:hypothetical protein
MKYSQSELKAAFDKVCNPEDWRDSIAAEVKVSDIDITLAAISHFTATHAHVSYRTADTVTIYSEGYRLGPAGP